MEEEAAVCRMRAEYKKSAVYGDIIFPRAARDGQRTVAELGSRDGSPYAVIELQG